jgi:hypothetical protein
MLGKSEEELVRGDEGPLLIVRRLCFAPHKSTTKYMVNVKRISML